MSKYTTEVRFICEHEAGYEESAGYKKVNEIIEQARAKIFDFDYPIFDVNYKSVLETKILKHFYTREIGAESVGLWKLWLDTRMNEVMPLFNKLYESELIHFNPLVDTEYDTSHNVSGSGNRQDSGTGTSSVTSSSAVHEVDDQTNTGSSSTASHVETSEDIDEDVTAKKLYSDTPQGGLTGIEENTYLTNATLDGTERDADNSSESDSTNNGNYRDDIDTIKDSTENSTSTGSSTNNSTSNYSNTEQYLEHIVGKRGITSYSKLLMEFRDTFLNIDMQVINSLNDLFMNLW